MQGCVATYLGAYYLAYLTWTAHLLLTQQTHQGTQMAASVTLHPLSVTQPWVVGKSSCTNMHP
jgi:hypothetical protein